MVQPIGINTLAEALAGVSSEQLVWGTVFDQRYVVQVQREGKARGKLVIFDSAAAMALIFHKDVDLAYGALFGPDVADLHDWQDAVENFIDGRL